MKFTKEQLDDIAAWIRAEALAAVAYERGSEFAYAFDDRAKAAREKVETFALHERDIDFLR